MPDTRITSKTSRVFYQCFSGFQVDFPLLAMVLLLIAIGFVTLYSASYENHAVLLKQAYRMSFAMVMLLVLAQIPPRRYAIWAPYVFVFIVALLLAVMVFGHVGKGAQRWLNLGVVRFQPSELLKIVLPLFLAWFFSNKQLPPSPLVLLTGMILLVVPVCMVAIQPDLGTAIIILMSGLTVIFVAGLSRKLIFSVIVLTLVSAPLLWHHMHDYQKSRVLIFLNPERDPLGAGYHIIQSKIAIGSGGLFGKGWLHGTQSHLQFLPEHKTDFIFSVFCEEFGFVGCMVLLSIIAGIVIRGLQISFSSKDTFSKMLACSLTVTFFISVFVNLGMVTGLLPVVGLPLPLVSYGGSSSLTVMALFGVLMSIQAHKKLLD
jgi:rod shape determining protein RodA